MLLAGLLAVHQLRYTLAFGDGAGWALAEHGHGYLAWVTPSAAALTAFALGRALVRAAAGVGPAQARCARLRRLWPAASIALLGVYSGQELVEGWLSQGHPDWWAGVAGSGGWTAVPLALVFGGVVACMLRLSGVVQARLTRGCFEVLRTAIAAPGPRPFGPQIVDLPLVGALARHLAGRAPPLRSS